MNIAALRKTVYVGLAALCLSMYAVPAHAQYSNGRNNNWYDMHQQYSSRCYSQRQQGHWARNQQYESWCANNQRFRNTHPDAQWRRNNPHDSGRQHDNVGDHQ
jgi:hypothetical protein